MGGSEDDARRLRPEDLGHVDELLAAYAEVLVETEKLPWISRRQVDPSRTRKRIVLGGMTRRFVHGRIGRNLRLIDTFLKFHQMGTTDDALRSALAQRRERIAAFEPHLAGWRRLARSLVRRPWIGGAVFAGLTFLTGLPGETLQDPVGLGVGLLSTGLPVEGLFDVLHAVSRIGLIAYVILMCGLAGLARFGQKPSIELLDSCIGAEIVAFESFGARRPPNIAYEGLLNGFMGVGIITVASGTLFVQTWGDAGSPRWWLLAFTLFGLAVLGGLLWSDHRDADQDDARRVVRHIDALRSEPADNAKGDGQAAP